MDARFSKPVMPGDALTVKMWGDGSGTAIFQTVNQDGAVVIDGGRFEYDDLRAAYRLSELDACRARRAAAPIRGPSAPSAPGTMRVPREKSRRQRASISACAAAKNGSPKPSATEPRDDRESQVEQVGDRRDRAADERAGARDDRRRCVGRAAGR